MNLSAGTASGSFPKIDIQSTPKHHPFFMPVNDPPTRASLAVNRFVRQKKLFLCPPPLCAKCALLLLKTSNVAKARSFTKHRRGLQGKLAIMFPSSSSSVFFLFFLILFSLPVHDLQPFPPTASSERSRFLLEAFFSAL